MATFVHIADERDGRSIQRNGLRLPRLHPNFVETDIAKLGVFALPLIENFVVSHQWVRELKRRGHRTAVGVYFKIPDTEPVWVGKYNEPKELTTAAGAVAMLRACREMGVEAVIPRSISASEVRYVRSLPQTVGWRYFPAAKGAPPFCGCWYCQRGNIKSRKLQAWYNEIEAAPRSGD